MMALKRMDYDLVALGEKEILYGLYHLDRLLLEHGLTAVSNNVLDYESGEPRYEPYSIIKAGHLEIGITAAIGGEALGSWAEPGRQGIVVADGIAKSREVLEVFKEKKVDIKVLVAHYGWGSGEALADALPGFDVILVSHRSKALEHPTEASGIIFASCGSGSDRMGVLTLTAENGTVRGFEGRSLLLKRDDGPVDKELREMIWTKLELDEKGNRIRKKPVKGQVPQEETSLQKGTETNTKIMAG